MTTQELLTLANKSTSASLQGSTKPSSLGAPSRWLGAAQREEPYLVSSLGYFLSLYLVTTGLVLLTTLGDWTQACKCILSCVMEMGLLWPALGYFMVSTKYSVSLSLTNTSLCHHGLVGWWWSTWNIGMLWGSTSSWCGWSTPGALGCKHRYFRCVLTQLTP